MQFSARTLAVALAAVGSAALALSAWAQVSRDERPPLLHQDIIPPEPGEGRANTGPDGKPVFGPSPQEGQNPSAFGTGSKILSEPETGADKKASEPVHGQGGFAADRDTQAVPDRQTGPDATLHYVTVFNPSVLPFKRMSAMDAAESDYRLHVSNPNTRIDLTIGGKTSPDRDLFWGSVMVELQPQRDVAIPSVAPDMRILSYEIEPRVNVVFSKDGADNFYVRSDETGAGGTYRLVFMADADAGYFAPQVPSRYRVRDATRLAPAGLLKPLPAAVQRMAERAHHKLDVNPNMELDTALNRLIYYFRGFEAKQLPGDTGDIYWDLFMSKAGVCRHRSFVFMITANALGIPTRYVTNEAHAWVEVWIPSRWLRVDLGGAAMRMNVDNASDKSLYQPRTEDPFDSPRNYDENYTRLQGDISGLSPEQIAEGRDTAESRDGDETAEFDPESPADTDSTPDVQIGPGKSLPEAPEVENDVRQPTTIEVSSVAAEGFRGESILIEGALYQAGATPGKGIGGQLVNIWLAPAGNDGDDATFVGRTVTKPDGSFRAAIQIPDDLALASYEVYASTDGDARFAGSVSR